MMTVGSVTGTNNKNMQSGSMGINAQTDSFSKSIQNQIANAREKLQELSSNEDMSLEEKMKKGQEIQQEITTLNQQLRQHQIEQRKEKQTKGVSMEDMLGGSRKTANSENNGCGLSQASMQAMVSADTSMKQARVQGSVATQMEGRAGVLEAEIKMDRGRGASTEKKEAELADVKKKAQSAEASQISTLADASKAMKEAAKTDQSAKAAESKNKKPDKTENKTENKTESKENDSQAAESAEKVQTSSQTVHYTPIDVRL